MDTKKAAGNVRRSFSYAPDHTHDTDMMKCALGNCAICRALAYFFGQDHMGGVVFRPWCVEKAGKCQFGVPGNFGENIEEGEKKRPGSSACF